MAGSALVIGLLMTATFIVYLNEMMLGVALPTLIVDLDVTPGVGQWVTTGFLLTMAVLVPTTGFVMRRFHLRAIFFGALCLFILGTTIAAAASGFEMLLAGRIVQASGTAVFMPLLMTTTMRLVPVARRGRMMAVTTAVPAVAPAVGPALSGVVLSVLSWRWLFILMLPLALLVLLVGMWKLRNITTPEPVTLDLLSVVLSAAGFGGLVYGLSLIGDAVSGQVPIPPVVPMVVGVLGIAAFVLRQIVLQQHDRALLDMRIFRRATFNVPLLVMVVVSMLAFGILVVLPLVLTDVTGLSRLGLGLFLFPGGVAVSVVSALGGRIYDRFGPRLLVLPGAIVWTAGLFFLSTVDEHMHVVTILVVYLVFRAAQAMMWAPVTTSALASLRADLYTHGSAAFTTLQQLAGAVGGAILVSAYTIGSGARDASVLTLAQSVSAGRAAFLTAGVIACVAVLGGLFVSGPDRGVHP